MSFSFRSFSLHFPSIGIMGLLCHAQVMWCWGLRVPNKHDTNWAPLFPLVTDLTYTHIDLYEYIKSETTYCKTHFILYWNIVTTSLEFQFLAEERAFFYFFLIQGCVENVWVLYDESCSKHCNLPLIKKKKSGSGTWLLSLSCSYSPFCLTGLLRLDLKMPFPYFIYHHNPEASMLRLK